MRLELRPGSGNVDRLYTEERGVEGRGDSSSSSKEGVFDERIFRFDVEVAVELRTDPASRTVPTVDWDWFLKRDVGFSREQEDLL